MSTKMHTSTTNPAKLHLGNKATKVQHVVIFPCQILRRAHGRTRAQMRVLGRATALHEQSRRKQTNVRSPQGTRGRVQPKEQRGFVDRCTASAVFGRRGALGTNTGCEPNILGCLYYPRFYFILPTRVARRHCTLYLFLVQAHTYIRRSQKMAGWLQRAAPFKLPPLSVRYCACAFARSLRT